MSLDCSVCSQNMSCNSEQALIDSNSLVDENLAIHPTSMEEVQDFLDEISMEDCQKAGWTLVCHKEDCNVWAMKGESSGTVKIKVDGSPSFREIPLEVLIDVITSPLHMDKWDKNMLDFRTVKVIDEHTRVNYYSVSMPSPLKNRDWTLRQSIVVLESGTPRTKNDYIIFNKSCSVPDLPESSEFVRANCILNGWHIKPTPDGHGCLVHYYAHNEFLGSIPTFLVNWATKVLASTVVSRLRQACDVVINTRKTTTAIN